MGADKFGWLSTNMHIINSESQRLASTTETARHFTYRGCYQGPFMENAILSEFSLHNHLKFKPLFEHYPNGATDVYYK